MAKRLGQLGDVIEFGTDAYNNFTQDGVSSRAFIATGIDGFQMLLSGAISSAVGTVSGSLAGGATALTIAGAPAAPVVGAAVGVSVGVATDTFLDNLYDNHLRTPIINGAVGAYEWINSTYNWVIK